MSTLAEILDSRENRADMQHELLEKFNLPLVSFTMNIPGSVKFSQLIEKAFRIGLERLFSALKASGIPVVNRVIRYPETGPEAFITCQTNPLEIKKITCEIEELDDLGRLMDMDVFDPETAKAVSRSVFSLEKRKCLLCDGDAKLCAVMRTHPLEQVIEKANRIMKNAILDYEADRASECAVKALLYEVSCTPKPGLVDKDHNGSHKDMNFLTFCSSAAALAPYFRHCYITAFEAPDCCRLFHRLQVLGKQAEGEMFRATGGVNTHKGAIFTLGIMIASFAMTRKNNEDISRTFHYCEIIGKNALMQLKSDVLPETSGQRIYARHGLEGVRGEVAVGLPSIRDYGLPFLEKLLSDGWDENFTLSMTLVKIMSVLDDTNVISRAGIDAGRIAKEKAIRLLNDFGSPEKPDDKTREKALEMIRRMDSDMVSRNISPGGSADMLAGCCLMHFLSEI